MCRQETKDSHRTADNAVPFGHGQSQTCALTAQVSSADTFSARAAGQAWAGTTHKTEGRRINCAVPRVTITPGGSTIPLSQVVRYDMNDRFQRTATDCARLDRRPRGCQGRLNAYGDLDADTLIRAAGEGHRHSLPCHHAQEGSKAKTICVR
jgi:hypothetical protein